MRKIIPPDRWGLAVYVLIKDARGRVLMLRRSRTVKHFPGLWELPGGKPAPGENFAKTAIIEVSEETGLDIIPSHVVGAVEGAIPGLRLAMLIFEARAPKGEVTLSAEHDTFSWLPLSEINSHQLRPGFDSFFTNYTTQHTPPKKTNRAKTGKRT